MLTALLTLLGSSAFGSIIGGAFAFLNRKADMESKRLDLEHEQARWSHELAVKDKQLEIAQAEAKGVLDVAIAEGDARVEAARMAAIAQAQQADKVTAEELKAAGGMRWLLVLALAFNKWVRPVATVVLAGAAIKLNWLIADRLVQSWPSLTQAQQMELGGQAVAWVAGQAAAALGYWFVARGSSR